ncbi:MAG: glucoamylase family protein [Steroidobacteraceae bacterium]
MTDRWPGAWRLARAALCVAGAFHLPASAGAAAATLPLGLAGLERPMFEYFWDNVDPRTGLIPDRMPSSSYASIAGLGFGLTAYVIGAQRHYVTRAAALARCLQMLRTLSRAPAEHGIFYHFIDLNTLRPTWDSDVSPVDSALLFGGIVTAESYFDGPSGPERELRLRAQRLLDRADWRWVAPRSPAVAMDWSRARGFADYDWIGYNEAVLMYVLAIGSRTHPLPAAAWSVYTAGYQRTWGVHQGYQYVGFGPLFGHEFSEVWINFRGIADPFMRAHGIDYFINSRRAVLAQRRYAIENPDHWRDYGPDIWGLSASDGPGDERIEMNGTVRRFWGYEARGDDGDAPDDGTLAPLAVLAALPFAPHLVEAAIEALRARFGARIYGRYGFVDAFNPSFGQGGWFDHAYVGIDTGAALAMLENYRSGLIWRLAGRNPNIVRGLRRAGFSGGWLTTAPGAPKTLVTKGSRVGPRPPGARPAGH